jgi:hypothetical protein
VLGPANGESGGLTTSFASYRLWKLILNLNSYTPRQLNLSMWSYHYRYIPVPGLAIRRPRPIKPEKSRRQQQRVVTRNKTKPSCWNVENNRSNKTQSNFKLILIYNTCSVSPTMKSIVFAGMRRYDVLLVWTSGFLY